MAFLGCVLYYMWFYELLYYEWYFFFEEFLIETCKVSMNNIGAEEAVYDDFEFVILWK